MSDSLSMPMDALVARIGRTMRSASLVPAGARVLVAVSGGADSMALLYVLRDLESRGDCRVAGVAHLNHGLRGKAADEDEAFCRKAAASLGLPFECQRTDVRALAAERRLSIEAAGHEARYEFFERAAARTAADCVAVAHTRDDQAETFLLRLLRGAGPRGLAGMHPRAGLVVRPMLDCSREEVRRFVAARRIAYREDATNADLAVARNRVRHDVIPHLAAFAPAVARVLAREAAIAREDAQFLDAAACAAFARLVTVGPEAVRIDAGQLRLEPAAIARRVAALAMGRFAGGRFVGFEHVESLLDLIRRPGSDENSRYLPGQHARRTGHEVLLTSAEGRAGRSSRDVTQAAGTNSFRFSLSIPGEVVSPLGWAVSAEFARWDDDAGDQRDPGGVERTSALRALPRSWAVLDADTIRKPLIVRRWRAGDRIRPLGMTGTRKLQDLFVDSRVPRERRGDVPVVADIDDRVVWVGGHAIAGDFRVTGATRDVVILKLKYWRNGT